MAASVGISRAGTDEGRWHWYQHSDRNASPMAMGGPDNAAAVRDGNGTGVGRTTTSEQCSPEY